MNKILDIARNNPVRVYSLLAALFAVGAAFGFRLSGDQQTALLGLAALLLGGGEVVRTKVTPV